MTYNKKKYLVYRSINSGTPTSLHNGSLGFTVLKPTMFNVLRFAKSYYPFIAWYFFHHFGVFYNHYFSMIVLTENNQLVHRTCVFPGFYKFPFMAKEDLQLGEIWTREDYRNKGVATLAIKFILDLDQYKKKTFWYVVGENNHESIRLAEKSGFNIFCTAYKKNKMGISFIGKYEIAK